ncbi:hypothetical protein [Spiroplasma cantharicola]|uniref:Uncharacterized protein n=1 Tax=Spiroplasma cantharicola TaxID=362837 RepID=A0A0M4JSJ0_9MOLU|nr:hypothetical protein [Spiroplasma cantharicola]ALD66535.1 hypothetical protein SCANT_v1c06290 [Spiroplasma cantharicola]
MTSRNVAVIIIVLIWLIMILVTGTLALIFKEKYKSFKSENFKIKEQIKILKDEFKIKKVDIDFELPKGEECYFFSDKLQLYKIKLKNQKEKEDYKKELKESDINFSIYITNKRLMIQLKNQYFQYSLKDIVFCNYLLIYVNKIWNKYIELEVDNDKYIILLEDFDLFLTIKELIKRR